MEKKLHKDIKKWTKDNCIDFNENTICFDLHVLIERNDDIFTAHCLEFDIVADEETEKEGGDNLIISIGNHITFCIENKRLDKIIRHAPKEYWDKFYFCTGPPQEPMRVNQWDSWSESLLNKANVVRGIDARAM
jgi:hypothetical protein